MGGQTAGVSSRTTARPSDALPASIPPTPPLVDPAEIRQIDLGKLGEFDYPLHPRQKSPHVDVTELLAIPGKAFPMKPLAIFTGLLVASMTFGCPTSLWGQASSPAVFDYAFRETEIVNASSRVLKEIMEIPVRGIPAALLADARGMVIIPGMLKGGFIVGVRRGHGVVLVRDEQNHWQPPVFATVTGGSLGWQIGIQSDGPDPRFQNLQEHSEAVAGELHDWPQRGGCRRPRGSRGGRGHRFPSRCGSLLLLAQPRTLCGHFAGRFGDRDQFGVECRILSRCRPGPAARDSAFGAGVALHRQVYGDGTNSWARNRSHS